MLPSVRMDYATYPTASVSCLFFFFTDPPTPEIYTLSLHDALPISRRGRTLRDAAGAGVSFREARELCALPVERDRKSTRLNSSHMSISYAVFCLKKKKNHGTRRKYHHTPRKTE